jgi:Flp pilus assembly protein TadG
MYSVSSGGSVIAKSKGAALIEFALTLPLYVAVLLAIIDFSNYLNDRSVLTAAAYNGAKAGATKCNKPGQAKKAAKDEVSATLEGMLSVEPKSGSMKISGSRKPTPTAEVRRYLVEVSFEREPEMMSLFTANLDTFKTLSARGVAVCQ